MILELFNLKSRLFLIINIIIIFSCGKNDLHNNYIKTKYNKIYNIDYSYYIEKPSKKDLTISFADFPDNFNPYRANKSIEYFFKTALFSSLFYIDPKTSDLKVNMIANYSISKDGLTYYFSLKSNLKFNNGSSLESKDVIASLSLLEDVLKNTSLYNKFYVNNVSLKMINISSTQFAIKMDKPNINILYALADFPIIPENVVKKIKDNLDEFINQWDIYKNHIIGSGPYILEVINEEKAVLIKNPYYFKIDDKKNMLPYSNRIIIDFCKNNNRQITDFINGDSDVIPLAGDDFKKLYDYYSSNSKENIRFIDTGFNVKKCLIAYNCYNENSKTYLCDVKMRKYLSENIHGALLKKTVKNIEFAFSGVDGVAKYKNELFTDINNDGILEYKDGNSVFIRIIAPEEEDKVVEVAKIAFESLKKIDINVSLEIVPYHIFLEKIFYTKNYDIAFFYYNFYPGIISYYNLLKSKNLNFNPVIKDDEKSDELIEKLLNSSIAVNNIESQKNIKGKIDKFLKSNYQLYTIFQEKKYYLIRGNIYNFKINSSLEDYLNLRTIETIIKSGS